MARPIVNLNDLQFSEFGKGERFRAARASVSDLVDANRLAYAVIRLPPGKRAWPYHAHYVIEEMFYILEGEGTLRHAGEQYSVRQGDFICSPADPDQPHQIINSSDRELVYLALSTKDPADVTLYPDSGKYGAWAGKAADPRGADAFHVVAREDTAVDYWDGEED